MESMEHNVGGLSRLITMSEALQIYGSFISIPLWLNKNTNLNRFVKNGEINWTIGGSLQFGLTPNTIIHQFPSFYGKQFAAGN